MNVLEEIQKTLERHEELGKNELVILKRLLAGTLDRVSKKLQPHTPKRKNAYPACPHCSSANVVKHANIPTPRFRCKVCKHTFTKHRQLLKYRRQKPMKFIDLIVLTYTTDMTIAEIVKEIGITPKTYYVWREDLVSILPQLAEKLNNQRKK
ncbi:hypothetical protein N0M98_23255 [Paenibacillus doosanensis]|uniref:transposase-like zinc-binding domain-containing protein n=1 Tax=Paenibacillus doosanensis TaxID=1229154 RepID=UPI0021808CC3|nr:hypothetical protein [Paenibacillus doosanensis]MCS7463049.1 hypothetical protein [Paenibacillus doosanensis]